MTITESAQARDEAQLRELIADQMSAICAKDLDRLMNHYAADVVVFDVKPPFQTKGADAWRRTWEACLPCVPDSFQTAMRDLSLTVSGDLALAHWLWRFTGREKDHPAMQTWFRGTAGYRRIQGRWQIVHEHASVPFDPLTSQAAFTLDPQSNTGAPDARAAPDSPGDKLPVDEPEADRMLTWKRVCEFLKELPGAEEEPPALGEGVRVRGKVVAFPARLLVRYLLVCKVISDGLGAVRW